MTASDLPEYYAVVDGIPLKVLRGRPGDNVFEVAEPLPGGDGTDAGFRRVLVALDRVDRLVEGALPAMTETDSPAERAHEALDELAETPDDAPDAPDDPAEPDTVFRAHYTPEGIQALTRRAWSEAGIYLAVASGFIVLAAILLSGWFLIVAVVVALVPVIGGIRTAVETPGSWSRDERLAVAVGDEGVTIPQLGTVGWERITGVELHHGTSLAARGPRLRITFRGDASHIRALNPAARRAFVGARGDGTVAHDVAYAAALDVDTFADAVAAVTDAAAERGIPVA